MNKILLLFLIFALPALAFSQSDTTKTKKFMLASVSFELGRMADNYSDVDLEMMYDLTKNPTELDRDLTGHEATYTTVVAGSKIGASIMLVPFKKKENDYSTTSDIRIGIFYSQRGTSLDYLREDSSGAYQSVGYSTRFKELNLNLAYVWKFNPKFAERFTLHAGLALGFGTTFKDRTSVVEHFSSGLPAEIPFSKFNIYDGKSSFFGRVYAPIGIDYALGQHFDLGVQSTFGTVLQQVYGGENYVIPFTWSLSAKLSFFF